MQTNTFLMAGQRFKSRALQLLHCSHTLRVTVDYLQRNRFEVPTTPATEPATMSFTSKALWLEDERSVPCKACFVAVAQCEDRTSACMLVVQCMDTPPNLAMGRTMARSSLPTPTFDFLHSNAMMSFTVVEGVEAKRERAGNYYLVR
jgi:hypothetical protein